VGIYLEHATNASLIARNRIARVQTGINVEWRYGGVGSADNTFAGNRIIDAQRAGLFVDVGSDRNRILDNIFAGVVGPAIVLQGSSENIALGNRACGGGPMLREQAARYDDGSPAPSLANRLARNKRMDLCSLR
jgi:parallel beta-helix repeat protein